MTEGDLEDKGLAGVVRHRVQATWMLCVDELSKRQSDVASDLPEEEWRDVTASVEWHSRRAPVAMPELFVRAVLADFNEAESFKTRGDLACAKYRTAGHNYATWTVCRPTNSEVR